MITIRQERPTDVAAREALLDAAFGAARIRKASRAPARRPPAGRRAVLRRRRRQPRHRHRAAVERLGRRRVSRRCCSARSRSIRPAASRGIGAALMRRALREARKLGHGAVLLVGDAPYYSRFGFSAETTAASAHARPVRARPAARARARPGALDGARGMLRATGRPRKPAARQAPRRIQPKRQPTSSWTPRVETRASPVFRARRCGGYHRISASWRTQT